MTSDPAATWAVLAPPPDGFAARPHPSSERVWLAVDAQGRRHLIIRASSAEPGQTLLMTRGLHAITAVLSIEEELDDVWADIACLDPALNDTFILVANDLAEEAAADPLDPVGAVLRTLRTWQWFWGIESGTISGEGALGLFGELWFIDRWIPFPDALDSWVGPTGHRHDFTAPTISVEAKATRVHADGAARHRITSLDQLTAPETGSLFLFSLQVVTDPNARNTLPSLISRVRERLAKRPDLIGDFDRNLARVGWTPVSAEHFDQPYRVVAEELYEVRDGFPRLTIESFSGGIPAGVDDVQYALDLVACSDWRVATLPAEAAHILAGLRA